MYRRRERQEEPRVEGSPGLAPVSPEPTDAQFAQEMLQLTITNADVKTSVLVAAIALTLGVGAPAIPFDQALDRESWPVVAAGVIGVVALVLCGLSGLHLVLALRPRLRDSEFSRYSLPDIASAPLERLVGSRREDDRREAWIQVKNLAAISVTKHGHIRRALTYYPVAVVLMVVAMVLALFG